MSNAHYYLSLGCTFDLYKWLFFFNKHTNIRTLSTDPLWSVALFYLLEGMLVLLQHTVISPLLCIIYFKPHPLLVVSKIQGMEGLQLCCIKSSASVRKWCVSTGVSKSHGVEGPHLFIFIFILFWWFLDGGGVLRKALELTSHNSLTSLSTNQRRDLCIASNNKNEKNNVF
jgi:hypothetical protein